MKTILVSNFKGGSGKTTTAVNLAYILARNKKKVIFIDTDQQGNSTITLGGKIEGKATLYDVLSSAEEISLDVLIQKTRNENLDIIAGDPCIKEVLSKMSQDTDGQFLIKDLVKRLKPYYDYCIIDSNPANDIMQRANMIACDTLIIPVFPDLYSVQGLSVFTTNVAQVKNRFNESMNVAGILLGNVNKRTNMFLEKQNQYRKIAEKIGTTFFKTSIKHTNEVNKAIEACMPVVEYKPNCSASMDYEDFVEELEEKGVI